MPLQVQFRRGTTQQNQSFTGAAGEISVDTTLKQLRLHDGSTAGGSALPAVGTVNTFTNTQVFNGSASVVGSTFLNASETVSIVAAAPASTTNFYVNSGTVQLYTSNAVNNWTTNIAFGPSTSFSTATSVGQAVTMVLLTTQGASTAYYNSAVQIDGTTSGVTTYWQGGTAPTKGYVSGIDAYTYVVIKTAATPTYYVLASQTQF
jgi:hypothetical protein